MIGRLKRNLAAALLWALCLLPPAGCCGDPGACGRDDADVDAGEDMEADAEPDDVDAEPDVPEDSGDIVDEELPPLPERVDTFWGEAPDGDTRLAIFDELWELFARSYPCFAVTGTDWDAVRASYRPRVQEAESYGRFYALLAKMFFELRDGHVQFGSRIVCETADDLRPPVFFIQSENNALGACVTALDDDSLLVYRVEPGNPAGLEPGDRLVGYDGTPWRTLVAGLLDMELPLCGNRSTTDRSSDVHLMEAIMFNAHLFEELDIVRRGETGAEPFPTRELIGYDSGMACTDQVALEGVEFPWTEWEAWGHVPDVSYAMLPGTNIGYVYVYCQGFNDVWTDLPAAIEALWDTDGLIIDQRFNRGGTPGPGAFALTMNTDVDRIMNCAPRDPDSEDMTAIVISDDAWDYIDADESTFYDHPIAILTGPKAGSGGDVWPYKMSYHPRVRRFGRATNGAFSGWMPYWDTDPYIGDLWMNYPPCIIVDSDENLMHGRDSMPEEEVWLSQDDVAQGTDTVVEAALDWIASENE